MPRVVFRVRRAAPVEHARDFAPLESVARDDELVYPVPVSTPTVLSLILSGKQSLSFELFVSNVFCCGLLDSGASHSFLSEQFVRENSIAYRREVASETRVVLADGRNAPLLGVATNCSLRLDDFVCKQSFYVLRECDVDCVLGMDFLVLHDPEVRWRQRQLRLHTCERTHTIHAVEHSLSHTQSDHVEICSFPRFCRLLAIESGADCPAYLGCVLPERAEQVDNGLPQSPHSGRGAHQPEIHALLCEFSDVIVNSIPGGLPPERFAPDGTRIEHTIDTAPGVKPFARPPRPVTNDELEEIKSTIAEFLANGWIVPSLSPWAAPVLFVPKKRDPVTGKLSWRMVISYVRLNAQTLNRVAYRLPRIADLLVRVSAAKYFTKLDLLSGYYQIRMRESDVAKTAFTTPIGNFEFRVMAMGLCGAPGTFQHLMEVVFAAPARLDSCMLSFDRFVAIYLDDISIYSATSTEHVQHVRASLQGCVSTNCTSKTRNVSGTSARSSF